MFNPFMTEAVIIYKTSPFICSANQWIGFYVITTSFMKGLRSLGIIPYYIPLNRKFCLDLKEACFTV